MGLFGRKRTPEEQARKDAQERAKYQEQAAKYKAQDDKKAFEMEEYKRKEAENFARDLAKYGPPPGTGTERCNCCICKNCDLEHNHWEHDRR
jgi:hypothetical protein